MSTSMPDDERDGCLGGLFNLLFLDASDWGCLFIGIIFGLVILGLIFGGGG